MWISDSGQLSLARFWTFEMNSRFQIPGFHKQKFSAQTRITLISCTWGDFLYMSVELTTALSVLISCCILTIHVVWAW